jgi:hypothetical protein
MQTRSVRVYLDDYRKLLEISARLQLYDVTKKATIADAIQHIIRNQKEF